VNPRFLFGWYGYIFHGTGNSAQLCQNFRRSGGFELPLNPHPRYTTGENHILKNSVKSEFDLGVAQGKSSWAAVRQLLELVKGMGIK
jgi:hypothetical protein